MKILPALLLLSIFGCASNPTTSRDYSVITAMEEAGKYVAHENTRFFMFRILPSSLVYPTSSTLKRHLSEAAKSASTLAIIGSDHALNYEILKLALSESEEASLVGASKIYVGDSDQFSELEELALRAGTMFKATTYPK